MILIKFGLEKTSLAVFFADGGFMSLLLQHNLLLDIDEGCTLSAGLGLERQHGFL